MVQDPKIFYLLSKKIVNKGKICILFRIKLINSLQNERIKFR